MRIINYEKNVDNARANNNNRKQFISWEIYRWVRHIDKYAYMLSRQVFAVSR